jgi:mannose-6-phosphate isomerase-like protein (cupin superfamily)
MALSLLIILVSYLIIGNLLHRVVFPEKKPDISTYFKRGEEFYSKTEGFRQRVSKQENGFVYGSLLIEPFAGGPPKHIHSDFDEIFEIENGELSFWVDGKIVKLHPGEKLHIAKGTPHQPFNQTADTIRVKGSVAFPEKFAFCLKQVYAVMDSQPGFENSPKAPLQLALLSTEGFDSYLAEGPPVFVQKAVFFFITPLARLLGFKSYVLSGYRFTPEREKHWTKNYYLVDEKKLNFYANKSSMI